MDCLRRTIFQFFRYTKIGDLDTALIVYEDVGTLDVTMDDASLVDIVQALQNLANEVADKGLFEGTVISQQRGDRTARNIFQEDVKKLFIG
jgi:hypothetical protein